MLRQRRELDFLDEQSLDERESDSDDAKISFNPQLRSLSLLTTSLTAMLVFFWVIFCGEIGVVKGCYGSGCEIGVGMGGVCVVDGGDYGCG
nr:hypothetical protein CFP56_72863 [Quercus suber]